MAVMLRSRVAGRPPLSERVGDSEEGKKARAAVDEFTRKLAKINEHVRAGLLLLESRSTPVRQMRWSADLSARGLKSTAVIRYANE